MTNEIKSFEDATEIVARHFVAGMDSAIRHSLNGDVDKYYARKSKERSKSWQRGYEYAANGVRRYGTDNLAGYKKEMLGDTCHDAELNLLYLLRDGTLYQKHDYVYTALENKKETIMETVIKKSAKKAEAISTDARSEIKNALAKFGIEFDETPLCIWFYMDDDAKEELEALGAKHSPKREAKGKTDWYFACPAA